MISLRTLWTRTSETRGREIMSVIGQVFGKMPPAVANLLALFREERGRNIAGEKVAWSACSVVEF